MWMQCDFNVKTSALAVFMICSSWTKKPQSRLVSLTHFVAVKPGLQLQTCISALHLRVLHFVRRAPTLRPQSGVEPRPMTSMSHLWPAAPHWKNARRNALSLWHLRCIVPRGCISNCWNSACVMHAWLCHNEGGCFNTTEKDDLGCPTQSQWLSGEHLILPLINTHTAVGWPVGWKDVFLIDAEWNWLGISHTHTCRLQWPHMANPLPVVFNEHTSKFFRATAEFFSWLKKKTVFF